MFPRTILVFKAEGYSMFLTSVLPFWFLFNVLMCSVLFISLGVHISQYSSVAQSCPTLCNPMNRSMPGLPVHHQLPEFTQTHVHRVSDAIQPSHPWSSPSPPAPNPSQHLEVHSSQTAKAWLGEF